MVDSFEKLFPVAKKKSFDDRATEMFEGSSSDITRGQKKPTNMKRKGAETKIWWGTKIRSARTK